MHSLSIGARRPMQPRVFMSPPSSTPPSESPRFLRHSRTQPSASSRKRRRASAWAPRVSSMQLSAAASHSATLAASPAAALMQASCVSLQSWTLSVSARYADAVSETLEVCVPPSVVDCPHADTASATSAPWVARRVRSQTEANVTFIRISLCVPIHPAADSFALPEPVPTAAQSGSHIDRKFDACSEKTRANVHERCSLPQSRHAAVGCSYVTRLSKGCGSSQFSERDVGHLSGVSRRTGLAG